MITNISRIKFTNGCWRYAFNKIHRGLEEARSMNLVDGSAFHDGVAAGLASRDWTHAEQVARARFEADLPSANIMPEEAFKVDMHWEIVKGMLGQFTENYAKEEYTIIQPECSFELAMPESQHNCVWMHWYDRDENTDKWGVPPPEKINAGSVGSPHMTRDHLCACWQPHRFKGKTDVIVSWHGNIWLVDHKTTALLNEQFWGQWDLDQQMTGYIYGIWKTLGIRPRGFVINALYKPSESQVNAWNQKRKYGPPKEIKDYLGFERRAFLRSEEDLDRFERQLVNKCNEWERRIIDGYFDMEPHSGACISYNRLCDYHGLCTSHDSPGALAGYSARTPDYVDVALAELTSRVMPVEKETNETPATT